ncbi:hypothetical protein AC1031_014386 [Aphanomyces cochlioides]|nr:hypothetical protein AC1031_014386 [Aphanomyces cochlioides]
MSTSDDAPRLKEAIRKRKYRAGKRRELIDLETQARRLEAHLAKLQTQHRAGKDNAALRTHVSQYQLLMQVFAQWVYVNEHPQKVDIVYAIRIDRASVYYSVPKCFST